MNLQFTVTGKDYREIKEKAERIIVGFGPSPKVSWSASYDVTPIHSFQKEDPVVWTAEVSSEVTDG